MEQTMFEAVMSYGALGAVAAYFAFKDWRLSEQVRQALLDFTTALKVLEARINE